MVRRAMAIAVLLLAGCPEEPPDRFVCHVDEQCVKDGVRGYCEYSNDCSFEDTSCDSQRRFAALSSQPGACVETEITTSLAQNGGFEMGLTAWVDESSRLEPSDDAHTLDSSVRVCRTERGDDTFAIADEPDIFEDGAAQGERFFARAWVKAAPSEAGQVVGIQFRPTGEGVDNFPPVVQTDPPIAPTDEWLLMTVEYEVPEPLARLEVLVEAAQEPDTDGCFLVDDVAVFRLP